ncbi:MAG: zinc ribbon domain-containing protein [Firmicutes bacterium]|nr:zinc ribbon domain-containing protein [Bacillota bacterium]
MPLREFQCKDCGENFEELVRNGTKVQCPKCKSQSLETLISAFGFKGPSRSSASQGACASCSGSHCSTCH